MEGVKIENIKGRFIDFTNLTAEDGYCFYDVDDKEEDRNYLTFITTPIVDRQELERKYVPCWGNADELNAECIRRREAQHDK